jgi:hypothetical protein
VDRAEERYLYMALEHYSCSQRYLAIPSEMAFVPFRKLYSKYSSYGR